MSIKAVTASMQAEAITKKNQKLVEGAKTVFSRPLSDVVARRDQGFGLRVYAQETLSRLSAIVNESAKNLGVNLETYDASPEATADRIAGFAIGMFSLYKKQNPDLTEEEALAKYEKYIGRAIDKGFNEALKILGGLGVTDAQTMDGIQMTYNLIQEKFSNFFAVRSELPA